MVRVPIAIARSMEVQCGAKLLWHRARWLDSPDIESVDQTEPSSDIESVDKTEPSPNIECVYQTEPSPDIECWPDRTKS